MKIVKRINTNAAIAIDSMGKEVVIFGKGVGFPQVPYELQDLSRIEQTFYDIDPRYYEMVAELPHSVISASAEIAEEAELELQCTLNPNLPFTLADHLNFAMTKIQQGIEVPILLGYDLKHLYPKETGIGFKALSILEQYTSVRLPDNEAYSVAMHIINAETENGNMDEMMNTLNLIRVAEEIIETKGHISLDRDSYLYSRFIMHLQYLISRLRSGEQVEEVCGPATQREIAREAPDAYLSAREVAAYLQKQLHCTCNNEEILYLTMHIHRLQSHGW